MKKQTYTSLEIEIIEIQTEKGFAQSEVTDTGFSMGDNYINGEF